ncbi:MAG: CHC2 zinc finger domain-containing protein [Bacteroidota bacterium]|jgi:hypothetical protein
MNPTTVVDAGVLKQHLPHYLTAIGHPPVIHPCSTRLTALCPLHADKKPSFSAVLEGDVWKWFCHPCGVGGTVIELHAARTGRSAKAEFKTICAEVAELIGLFPGHAPALPRQKTPPPAPAKASKAIDANELERLTTPWRTRLFEDTAQCEAFARKLGLSAETLRRLSSPSLDALGITPAGLVLVKADGTPCTLWQPRLAYIGDGGYKIRDPFGNGEPRFWRVGELRRPWRSHWLLRAAPVITEVHLVESESTAAALIEAGFNDPYHQGACVVATSGANGFCESWVPLFAERSVHFWPDTDAAGERFFEETATLLESTARRICRHHFSSQPPHP